MDECLFWQRREPDGGVAIEADGTCPSFTAAKNVEGFGGKYLAWEVIELSMANAVVAPGGGIALSALCLLYTSPSPRDKRQSRMPSSA